MKKKKRCMYIFFFPSSWKKKRKKNNNNKFGAENDLGYCPIVLQERHCIVIKWPWMCKRGGLYCKRRGVEWVKCNGC